MKTPRSFASLFGILALVAFVANTRVPAVADQRTFASQAAYYKLVANDFYRRLDTLKQFETSSGQGKERRGRTCRGGDGLGQMRPSANAAQSERHCDQEAGHGYRELNCIYKCG